MTVTGPDVTKNPDPTVTGPVVVESTTNSGATWVGVSVFICTEKRA